MNKDKPEMNPKSDGNKSVQSEGPVMVGDSLMNLDKKLEVINLDQKEEPSISKEDVVKVETIKVVEEDPDGIAGNFFLSKPYY